MKELRFTLTRLIQFLFLLQIRRKLSKSSDALQFLNAHKEDASNFSNARELDLALSKTDMPGIILLNKHALNITLNFLCNIKNFNGVYEKLILLVFDEHSRQVLTESFPEVKTVYWKLEGLTQKFSTGDGRYQLFQYFRAKLASYLTTKVKYFWMLQADTLWRTNLFETIKIGRLLNKSDNLLFDSEGESGLLSKMVAGGYFYVQSDERSKKFFDYVADTLLDYYVTDNNVMASLCLLKKFDVGCGKIPYSQLSNWRWTSDEDLPLPNFLQYDGGEGAEDKFHMMNSIGAAFVDINTLKSTPSRAMCNQNNAKHLDETFEIIRIQRKPGKLNFLIVLIHGFCELLTVFFPFLETVFLGYIFPFYAYYAVSI
uniref:Nucleotide-diphospho-sugar transferase domain-containing protein n=1 Tax=Acrobeloides nanus TaxID=290746 RepID=A0A914E2A1_9BILA